MKSILVVAAALALGAFGCSNLPITHTPAVDRAELLKAAMFDHDCPAEGIHVLKSETEASGTTRFELDVCGTKRTYKRVGSMYVEADRRDSTG